MAHPRTVVFTQTRDGRRVAELPSRDGLRYGWRLNRPGAIQFDLPARKLPDVDGRPTVPIGDVLEDGVHEVGVERGGQVVWLGALLTIDERADTISFAGEGLLAYARRWHVTATLDYTGGNARDQALIAKALIGHHQAKAGGDFRVDTSAVTATGVTRERKYAGHERKNIYDAVTQLGEVDGGFDLDIDPATRQLRVYYPRRGRRRDDIIFDTRNIRAFQRRRDATAQASQILGVGAGEDTATLLTNLQSSEAVARYGLTQAVYRNTDVSVPATLESHVIRELLLYRTSPNLIGITVSTADPVLGSYQVGDEVRIVWPSAYRPLDTYRRVVGLDVVHEDGEERAVVYLDELGATIGSRGIVVTLDRPRV
jgi:hypothetical protein